MNLKSVPKLFIAMLFVLCVLKIRLYQSGTINVQGSMDNEESSSCDDQSRSSRRLREALDSMEESNCKDCALRRANLTHEELKLLRFEIVKLQILQRLQLSKPPCIRTPKPALEPILQAADMDNVTNDEKNGEPQDKIKSYVIFPSEDEPQPCLENHGNPCNRLVFQLPQELDNRLISSSEVWLYKRNPVDKLKLTELVFDAEDESLSNMTDLATESATTDIRLVKFQLQNSTTWTQRYEVTVLEVQVSCYSGCSTRSGTSGVVSPDGQEKPFLLVKTINDKAFSRNRRSVDCDEDSILCCKEKLYMSFAEIGWDDWIIAPEGYDANYCRGKCFNDVGSSRYYHSSLFHRYMSIKEQHTIPDDIGLKMCCTPSKMSSLSILYMNENNTVVKSDLLHMKVESCDCV